MLITRKLSPEKYSALVDALAEAQDQNGLPYPVQENPITEDGLASITIGNVTFISDLSTHSYVPRPVK